LWATSFYASDTHHPLGFCGTSNPQPGFAAHPGKSRQIKDQRSFSKPIGQNEKTAN
jgi:hypothetical protein